MRPDIKVGDYTLSLVSDVYRWYTIYLHYDHAGWCIFKQDTSSLHRIYTNDTDLITLLLLKYQTDANFKIYPYKE